MSDKIDWKKFLKEFKSLNSFYRRGEFEIMVRENEKSGYVKLREGDAINLAEATDKLYEQAKALWDNSALPSQYFSIVMRAMIISFETDEYFISLTDEKKNFFSDFIDDFPQIESQDLTTNSVKTEINKFTGKIEGFSESEKDFSKLAYELILFSICGINVLYLKQNHTSYELGLKKARQLLKYIEIVSEIENNDSTSLKKKKLGLKGLTHFFEGRLNFALGKFCEAETAFKKSVSMYLEKMNCLVQSATQEDAETRTLSMRRAGLAEIIGLANMYLIESRIDEALEIVERVSPLLNFCIGKRMLAYCDLLKASIKRAKFSSNLDKLNESETQVENCIKVFEEFAGKSHSYHWAKTELSLIYFYKAKMLPENRVQDRKEFYLKCIANLDSAIKFARKQSNDKYRNRRRFIEALTNRSHIYRYLAKVEGEDFPVNLEKAVKDADDAVSSSRNLKQLESEAQIALGMAYKDLFFREADENSDYKKMARDCFFEALDLNIENNSRLSAMCYLRLTELEMFNQTNYLRANFFFKKYEQSGDKVGHQYVLDFAKELRKSLNERESFEFFLDPTKTLNLKHWQTEVKNFLIKQTIYYTALEKKDMLPQRRKRGEMPQENVSDETGDRSSLKKTTTKATRQSILAKAFTEKMGIVGNPAYDLAKKNLEELERWCELMNR